MMIFKNIICIFIIILSFVIVIFVGDKLLNSSTNTDMIKETFIDYDYNPYIMKSGDLDLGDTSILLDYNELRDDTTAYKMAVYNNPILVNVKVDKDKVDAANLAAGCTLYDTEGLPNTNCLSTLNDVSINKVAVATDIDVVIFQEAKESVAKKNISIIDKANNRAPDNSVKNIGDIRTNNTVFIKESITIDGKPFNIDVIRNMKYLPYQFKDKMCIGGSCIDKNNIKMIKGKAGFSLNTFTSSMPFRFFTEPNNGGWSRGYTTEADPDVSMNPEGTKLGIKSFKISDKNYMFTAYEKENYGGKRVDYTSSSADTKADFPKGFMSIQPRSIKGNLLNNSCLSLQTVIHVPGGNNELIQAVPCDISTDEFFISPLLEDDKGTSAVYDTNIKHKHDDDPDGIHFHDHSINEEYHFVPAEPLPLPTTIKS